MQFGPLGLVSGSYEQHDLNLQRGQTQGETSPDRDNIHAPDEVGCDAMVAEDLAQAALQRESGDADIEAGANAGQAAVLVGQRVCYSACLHSHLRQQGTPLS